MTIDNNTPYLIGFLTSLAKGTWWTRMRPLEGSPVFGASRVYPFLTRSPITGRILCSVAPVPKLGTVELQIGASLQEIKEIAEKLLSP